MNLKLIPVLALVAMLAATGCVDRDAQKQASDTKKLLKDTTRPVDTVEVVRRSVAETVEITGQIATSDDVTVGAPQPGRLVSVYVKDGDSVKAGQVLAAQESSDLVARVRQAQAQVNAARASLDQATTQAKIGPTRTSAALKSAEAGLRQAKAQRDKLRNGARPEEIKQAEANEAAARSNMDTAKKELDRTQQLFDAGAISQQRLEVAQNQFRTAQAQHQVAVQSVSLAKQAARTEDLASGDEQVRQAEEAVRSAKASQALDPVLGQQVDAARANLQAATETLQLQRLALADSQIRSPFSGRVSGSPAQPGTYLAPGSPVVRLVGAAGVYFEGELPESNVAQIQPGTRVEVRVDALAGKVYSGRVAAVDPMGDSVGRSFKARVMLEGDLSGVKPGMFARGVVQLKVSPNAAVVPASAVVREGGETFVFVVTGDVAKKVSVTLGLAQGDLVEVNGVGEGETVVTRGQNLLANGTKVLVENKK